jgi:YVTN family beta-propeller protein
LPQIIDAGANPPVGVTTPGFMRPVKLLFLVLALALGAPAGHAAPFAYIPDGETNSLTVIDLASNTAVDAVAVTGTEVAVNPAGTRVYVSHGLGPYVSVVDTSTNSILAVVNLIDAGVALGMAVTPDGAHVYVAGESGLVYEIDAATNTVSSSFRFSPGTFGSELAISPDGTRLYVTDHDNFKLQVIDLASKAISSTVAIIGPGSVAENLLGTRVYITGGCLDADCISVMDTATNTVTATVPLGASIYASTSVAANLAVTPDSALVYVAVAGGGFENSNRVVAIDANTNTISSTLLTGPLQPNGVAVNSNGTAVYVIGIANANDPTANANRIMVIDPACNTVIGSVPTGTSHDHFTLGSFGFGSFVAPPVTALPPPGGPPANLHVTGIEVTQGIQNLAGSVPLISGRRTFVRVYVNADTQAEAGVTAGLSAIGYIACTPGTCPPEGTTLGPLIPSNTVGPRITVVPSPKRGNLNDSFLFELPFQWTNYQSLRLHPVLNATGQPSKHACAKDILTEPLRAFQSATTLQIQFVRLSYRFPGLVNGVTNPVLQASVADQKQSESYFRRTYPLSNLILAPDFQLFDAGLGSRVARIASECPKLPATQQNMCAYNYVTAKLAALQASSGPLLGLLPGPPGSGFIGSADGAYGLIPQVPLQLVPNPPPSPFFTRGACCTQRIAAGPSPYADYAAHEIGHLLGRQHPVPGAAFCGHSASDPNYPYALSLIANPTNDATDLAGFDGGDAALAIPMGYLPAGSQVGITSNSSSNAFDNMGYCKQSWISDYTYNALYSCLLGLHGSVVGTSASCAPASGGGASGPGNWLTVSGNINPGAARADFIAQRLDRVVSAPPTLLGSYAIQLMGAGGATLASYPFAPAALGETELAGAGPLLNFAQVVPFIAGTQMIQILDSSANRVIGQKAVSPHPPLVGNVALQGSVSSTGIATLGWTASDADGDPLTFDIFFTRDSGVSLQPVMLAVSGSSAQIDTTPLAGGQGQFRVVASDGVNSAWADTASFTLPSKSPNPYIVTPADGQTLHVGQLLNLEGQATDVQDGVIGDTGLAWSDSGTPLGSGGKLSLTNLSLGIHPITLTATNSLGLSATVTVNVTVTASPVQPGPTLTAGPTPIGWQVAAGESNPQTATLNIGNAGSGSLEFMAQSNAPWLTLSTPSGAAPAAITLTADPSIFAAGSTARATVTLTAAGMPSQVIQIPATLYIGNTFVGGQPSSPVVPNVVGLTQSAATAAITAANLILGTVTMRSGTGPPGTVIGESPVAGASVAAGSAVNLVVSSGPLVGDVNGDGVVNCLDLQLVKAAFGSKRGQPAYNANADVNGDGVINIVDLSIVARAIPAGTTCN